MPDRSTRQVLWVVGIAVGALVVVAVVVYALLTRDTFPDEPEALQDFAHSQELVNDLVIEAVGVEAVAPWETRFFDGECGINWFGPSCSDCASTTATMTLAGMNWPVTTLDRFAATTERFGGHHTRGNHIGDYVSRHLAIDDQAVIVGWENGVVTVWFDSGCYHKSTSRPKRSILPPPSPFIRYFRISSHSRRANEPPDTCASMTP